MGHWMPPALLPSNFESHFHHLLLPMPCFQQRIPALCPAAERANHMLRAQPHVGGTELQGIFWENCSSCFSNNYIHFLTLHCIWFSIANDHTSFSCFWALEAILSKAKKLSAATAKEIFWERKTKTKKKPGKVLLTSNSPFWLLSEMQNTKDCHWRITLNKKILM